MGVEDSALAVPASLGDAGPHVRKVAGNIVAELDVLAKKLAPLQDTWTGDAYTYFYGLEQEWDLSARGLFGDGASEPGLLGFIANKLDVAWYNYGITQHANTQQWAH